MLSFSTGALETSNTPSALYCWCELEAIRAVCRHVGLRILIVDERQVAQKFEDDGIAFVELIGGTLPDMTCPTNDPALALLNAGHGFDCVVIQEDQHYSLAVPRADYSVPGALLPTQLSYLAAISPPAPAGVLV